jgi:hypothetical protein
MAVITMLSALIYPSIKGMSGYYKMTGAVDSVRAAWAQARAHAIEEGRPYRFAVVPETGRYRVAPDGSDYWSGGGGGGDRGFQLEESLPSGVRFSVTGGAPLDPVDLPDTGSRGGNGPVSSDSWSQPIIFLPDGTAREDAEIRFQVRGARTTSLCLRGLTGIVTVKSADSREGR